MTAPGGSQGNRDPPTLLRKWSSPENRAPKRRAIACGCPGRDPGRARRLESAEAKSRSVLPASPAGAPHRAGRAPGVVCTEENPGPAHEPPYMEEIKALIRVVREFGQRMSRNDLGAYGAALAYNFMFATGPLLLFLTELLGLVHVHVLALLNSGPIAHIVPTGVLSVVRSALLTATRQRSGAVLGLGIVGFLWGMSGAFRQIIDAMNHAYEFPLPLRRGAFVLYLTSIGLGAVIGLILAVGVMLAVLGRALIFWMAAVHVLPSALLGPALLLRWLLLFALLLLVLDILYAVAPDRRRRFRWITPGAVFALGGWFLLSLGFSIYAAHFSSYNRVYGTLGGIILLLLYLYLSGMALLGGALVNAMWEERRKGD